MIDPEICAVGVEDIILKLLDVEMKTKDPLVAAAAQFLRLSGPSFSEAADKLGQRIGQPDALLNLGGLADQLVSNQVLGHLLQTGFSEELTATFLAQACIHFEDTVFRAFDMAIKMVREGKISAPGVYRI